MENIKIKNIMLYGNYILDIKGNHECTICKNSINEFSIYNNTNYNIIINGVCGHNYHKECIESWIKENNKCPLCFQEWNILNIIHQ
jgi:hypothetical protein